MKKLDFLPVILGSDENAYGCARLFFDEYGVRPLLLCQRELPPSCASRILTLRAIKNFDTPEVFRVVMGEMLSALSGEAEKLIVIPCSDYYVSLCVIFYGLISSYAAVSAPSEAVFSRIKDKAAFAALCKNTELSHPETAILPPHAVIPGILPFDFPVVLKPENSNSYSYLHAGIPDKKKVYFIDGEEELLKVCRTFTDSGYFGKVIIQPYIPGDDRQLRVINAYCDGHSNVRVIGAARPLLQYRDPVSVGNYAALETVADRPLCDEAIRFLKEIKYVGIANFDVKIDPRNDKAYFLELNPRPGRSSYHVKTAGENLMKYLADDLVYGKSFTGTVYAEKPGVWSNVPAVVLKHSGVYPDRKPLKSVSLFYDFSPARAVKLIKRDISSVRLFKNSD